MTAYNAIPDSDIDPDSPLTTNLVTWLRDNPIAITEGASGAPKIVYAALNLSNDLDQGDIANSAIGQGELKTTSGTVSTTSSTQANFTLPGGSFGLFFQIKETGDGMFAALAALNIEPGSTYVANIVMSINSFGTATARQFYMQASPPYNLGDGDIPLFIFLKIDNSNGKVISSYVAPEAPWHYNGSTNIIASRYDKKTGKSYRNRKDMSDVPFSFSDSLADVVKLREYMTAYRVAGEIEEELTQEIKNADMNLIPHPFDEEAGFTIVMLDPVSPLMEQLLSLHETHDNAEISDMLHADYMNFGNTALPRTSPPGVDVVSITMKNTG